MIKNDIITTGLISEAPKIQEKKINKNVPVFSRRLPWWCKIVGYILSFVIVVTCSFFILVKGIEFGNDKVEKWLTSLVVSFLASVFLTQPVKTVLMAFFFVTLCRKSNSYDKFGYDDNEENGFVLKNPSGQDQEWLDLYKVKVKVFF